MLYIGLLVGGAIVVLVLAQMGTARSVPPIHNISTDVTDPPTFDVAIGLRGAGQQSDRLRHRRHRGETAGRVSARETAAHRSLARGEFRACGRGAEGHGSRNREHGSRKPAASKRWRRRSGSASKTTSSCAFASAAPVRVGDLRSVSRVGVERPRHQRQTDRGVPRPASTRPRSEAQQFGVERREVERRRPRCSLRDDRRIRRD